MRQLPRPDPTTDPPPVAAYLATVVELHLPDGLLLVVPDPGAATPRPGPLVGAAPVHLVTAANPWSIDLGDAENEVRNAEARATLAARGLVHVPAVGRDAQGTWREPGFGVLGADEPTVLALADDWCQHGIYRWDDDGWWLVLTDGSAPTRQPVRVERPT